MTDVDYPYEHILFYDDHGKAEIALEHVLTTFDAEAELIALSKGHPYAVTFTTEEEFTQQEADALVQTVTPSEYDLNYYPWDSDEDDIDEEDEE